MLILFSVFRAFFCLTCYSLGFSLVPVHNCFSSYLDYCDECGILLSHRSVSKGLQWLPWTLWRPSAGFGCDWPNSRPRFYVTSFIQGKCFYIVRYHCSLQLTTVEAFFIWVGGILGRSVSIYFWSWQVLDVESVQKWHKAVQRTIEEETRLANLYWLELSLPSK